MNEFRTVQYRVIGLIHSPFTDQKRTPIQSVFQVQRGGSKFSGIF